MYLHPLNNVSQALSGLLVFLHVAAKTVHKYYIKQGNISWNLEFYLALSYITETLNDKVDNIKIALEGK
jgi:hypothetical protein